MLLCRSLFYFLNMYHLLSRSPFLLYRRHLWDLLQNFSWKWIRPFEKRREVSCIKILTAILQPILGNYLHFLRSKLPGLWSKSFAFVVRTSQDFFKFSKPKNISEVITYHHEKNISFYAIKATKPATTICAGEPASRVKRLC